MSKVSTLGIAALSIASLCGCAAAAPQGTGMEATTGKTFGQWIDVYVAEQKAAYERHPDLPDIEKGAAMFLTTLGNRPDTTFNRDACTETGRRYYDAYKRFRESAKCERMLRQWQEAGGLSPEERDYRWLIYAIQAEDAHFSPSKPAGRAVAKLVARIYSNGRFTREEMDSIRHMLTRMAKVKGWTCGNLLIRPRGAGGWGSVMDVKKHYPFVSGIPAGRKAPNLSFTRYNANANLEKVDFHFSLDAFLTPQALLAIRDYVEKTTSPTPPPGGDFQLWAELKKGKPIFIFTEATQNTFDYIFDLFSKECLYDLFKDDVAFYHHTFDVRWDHDFGSNCEMYVPQVWRNHPLKISLPHSGYQYPISQAAWDAEIRDWGVMRYPVKSVPILKDRHGYNSV